MATKTEQLPQDVVEKLRKLQSDSNELIFELGQVEVRFLDLTKYKKSLEDSFTKIKVELDGIVQELEKKYPNGEISLADGNVTFEE